MRYDIAIIMLLLLTACGYKGQLHIPSKDEDHSKYGPVQTGFDLKPNQADKLPKDTAPQNQPKEP